MAVNKLPTRDVALKSGNQCAYPNCVQTIYDEDEGVYLGELAHIEAESPGDPRYNQEQSDSERNGVGNLMFMCERHHKIIGNTKKLNKFTVEYLLDMKKEHEKSIKNKLSSTIVDEIVKGADDYLIESLGDSDVLSADKFKEWLHNHEYSESDIDDLIKEISDCIDKVGELQNDTQSLIYNMVVHGNRNGSSLNKVIERTKGIREDRMQNIVKLLLEENILDENNMYSLEEQVLDLENNISYKMNNGNWVIRGSFDSLYTVWDFLIYSNVKKGAKDEMKKIIFEQDVTPLD